jgi:hypothetical protein
MIRNDQIGGLAGAEVPFTTDQVKGAPPIDVNGDLDQTEVDQMHAYYGLAMADGDPLR